jgi:hypothetical protein
LGLEASSLGTGQKSGGLAKGLDRVFREQFHGSPRLVKDTGRMIEEIVYGWPERRGRLFLSTPSKVAELVITCCRFTG